jgi:hypothetical protein
MKCDERDERNQCNDSACARSESAVLSSPDLSKPELLQILQVTDNKIFAKLMQSTCYAGALHQFRNTIRTFRTALDNDNHYCL